MPPDDLKALADKRIMLETQLRQNGELCDNDGCARPKDHLGSHVRPGLTEAVTHPKHYGGDTVYETIKVIAAWNLGFLLGNAVKYMSRAGKKDPTKLIEDLEKGRWYLDEAIQRLKRNEPLF